MAKRSVSPALDAFVGEADRQNMPLFVKVHSLQASDSMVRIVITEKATVIADDEFVGTRNLEDGVVTGSVSDPRFNPKDGPHSLKRPVRAVGNCIGDAIGGVRPITL